MAKPRERGVRADLGRLLAAATRWKYPNEFMHLTYASRLAAKNVVNGVKTIMVNEPLRIRRRASHRGIERAKGDARVQKPSPGIRNGQPETADDQIIRPR